MKRFKIGRQGKVVILVLVVAWAAVLGVMATHRAKAQEVDPSDVELQKETFIAIHPVAGDFDKDHVGRIMISAVNDPPDNPSAPYLTRWALVCNRYWGRTTTAMNGLPCQQEDAKVKISVYVTNGKGEPKENVPVYFRVKDPPDVEKYNPDRKNGDNRDQARPGTLDQQVANSVLCQQPNGSAEPTPRAIAEVELTITNRYSGDNYIVEVSLDQTFPAGKTQCTCILTAWKRMYVEYDTMPRSDKTAQCVRKVEADDIVATENEVYIPMGCGDDFAASSWVHVYDNGDGPNSAGEVRQIDHVDKTTYAPNLAALILKTNLNYVYRYSNLAHVAPVVADATGKVNMGASYYCPDFALVSSAFDPAFVEFRSQTNAGGGPVKYFPNMSCVDAILTQFSQTWFLNKKLRWDDADDLPVGQAFTPTGKYNYIQVIGACHGVGSGDTGGIASWQHNVVFVFVADIESWHPADPAKSQAENRAVLVHEMGHQFQKVPTNPQVHCTNNAYAVNPDDQEKCIMNYNKDMTNNKARFCLEHILKGFPGQPGIRDREDLR
jgi:hypothetical protein